MNKSLFVFLLNCLFITNLFAEETRIGRSTTIEKKGNKYIVQMGTNKPLTITPKPNKDGTIKYECRIHRAVKLYDWIAYIPDQGFAAWNNGEVTKTFEHTRSNGGKRTRTIKNDKHGGLIDWMITIDNSSVYGTFNDGVIYRDGIKPDGIFSERTFYQVASIQLPYGYPERKPEHVKAFLYNENKVVEEWGPLVDFAKSTYIGDFIKIDDQRHLLFAVKNEDSESIKTITIGPDVNIKKIHNQAHVMLQASDTPNDDAFRKRQRSFNDRTNIPFNLGMKMKDPESYSHVILVPDIKQEGSYFQLQTNGDLTYPNKASSLMPISTQKISGKSVINMIQGWVVGYSKPGGQKVWG